LLPEKNGLLPEKNGGLDFSKPPLQIGVSKHLLYDGFFSFAVARQTYSIDIILMFTFSF